ncbi:hypothetical protein EC843_10524 [Buttiauxella sp. JUb87]|uniref:hypothetical protein n=1 Tax=unclassified Buttiauxella TaxID=2634062 RepID=UPI001060F106|nr:MULTISPECIES: hypothetical protein [unclassified Buttiauxella]TDN50543.1 hypothetical protein EC843_10524 [Buttiauxella sp. JUb87]
MKALLLLIVLPMTALASMTASDLNSRIEHGGITQFYSTVSDDDWDTIISAIESGKGEWIGLVPQLASGADGMYGESLGIALASVIPNNPDAVLDVLNDKKYPQMLGIERVCTMPFIEPENDFIIQYYQKAAAALKTSGSKGTKCLSALNQEMQAFTLAIQESKETK